MFGNKGKKIAGLVKRRRWGRISKMLEKVDSETRAEFAAEFGNTKEDNAFNYLVLLLKDKDETVQLQAVKSLGKLGEDRAKVHLQNLMASLPKEKDELADAIRESISKINLAAEQNRKEM